MVDCSQCTWRLVGNSVSFRVSSETGYILIAARRSQMSGNSSFFFGMAGLHQEAALALALTTMRVPEDGTLAGAETV